MWLLSHSCYFVLSHKQQKKGLSHVIVHRLFLCMQKHHSFMVVLRGRFARTQKRLCRNRLWKSGAGAPKGSPVKGSWPPTAVWGILLKRLASATWPLAGSRAPLLLPRVPFAGVLKLAALKQSSTPDANSTHGIRHGLPGPRRTEVVPAMSPARGQAAVSIRAEQKNLKKTNPGL